MTELDNYRWEMIRGMIKLCRKFKTLNSLKVKEPIWFTMNTMTDRLIVGIDDIKACQSIQEIKVGNYHDMCFKTKDEMETYINLSLKEQLRISDTFIKKYGIF